MLKYPNRRSVLLSSKENKMICYSNRGQTLEDYINITNKFYLERNIAVIHKKPTPIQIVKVDYPRRSNSVIREAYYKTASTTDYNGIYRGIHVDFEAKETKQVSFPLRNVHKHQFEHMHNVNNQGGCVFILIRFIQTDEVYFLPFAKLKFFWQRMNENGRKSIKREELQKCAEKVKMGFSPPLDYISVVEKYVGRKG